MLFTTVYYQFQELCLVHCRCLHKYLSDREQTLPDKALCWPGLAGVLEVRPGLDSHLIPGFSRGRSFHVPWQLLSNPTQVSPTQIVSLEFDVGFFFFFFIKV